jgi:hypothetical protein
MNSYHTETIERDGYTISIDCFPDCDHGAPWTEEDGHGPVSEWTRRDKRPGEIVLHEDHGSRLYYDFLEAVKIARRDGWDAKPYNTDGHQTRGQQAAKAARADFEHLRAYCRGEWSWSGYVATITRDDGTQLDEEDSCWGFGDHKDMIEFATSQADCLIERDKKALELDRTTETEREHAEVWP